MFDEVLPWLPLAAYFLGAVLGLVTWWRWPQLGVWGQFEILCALFVGISTVGMIYFPIQSYNSCINKIDDCDIFDATGLAIEALFFAIVFGIIFTLFSLFISGLGVFTTMVIRRIIATIFPDSRFAPKL